MRAVTSALIARTRLAWDRLATWLAGSPVGGTLIVGLGLVAISHVCYYPSVWMLGQRAPMRVDDVLMQALDPLTNDLSEPILGYRIVLPLLAWSTGLTGAGLVLIPVAALVLTLALIFRVLLGRVEPPQALLATTALALTYMTQWGNTHPGISDSLTMLCLALVMLRPSPYLLAPCTVLGLLNDERYLLAMPFVLLWHAIDEEKLGAAIKRIAPLLAALALGVLVTKIVRQGITDGWWAPPLLVPPLYAQMRAEVIDTFQPWYRTWWQFTTGALLSFRWVWLLVLAALPCWIRSRPWWYWTGLLSMLAAGTIATMLVFDVERSVGFMWPVIPLAVVALERERPDRLRWLLPAVVALNAITPGLAWSGAGHISGQYPLPYVLYRTYRELGHIPLW